MWVIYIYRSNSFIHSQTHIRMLYYFADPICTLYFWFHQIISTPYNDEDDDDQPDRANRFCCRGIFFIFSHWLHYLHLEFMSLHDSTAVRTTRTNRSYLLFCSFFLAVLRQCRQHCLLQFRGFPFSFCTLNKLLECETERRSRFLTHADTHQHVQHVPWVHAIPHSYRASELEYIYIRVYFGLYAKW